MHASIYVSIYNSNILDLECVVNRSVLGILVYCAIYNTMSFIEHQDKAITARMRLQIPKV